MRAGFGYRLGFFQRILFGVMCCTALSRFTVIGRGLSFGSPMRSRGWLRVRGMQCQVLGVSSTTRWARRVGQDSETSDCESVLRDRPASAAGSQGRVVPGVLRTGCQRSKAGSSNLPVRLSQRALERSLAWFPPQLRPFRADLRTLRNRAHRAAAWHASKCAEFARRWQSSSCAWPES